MKRGNAFKYNGGNLLKHVRIVTDHVASEISELGSDCQHYMAAAHFHSVWITMQNAVVLVAGTLHLGAITNV